MKAITADVLERAADHLKLNKNLRKRLSLAAAFDADTTGWENFELFGVPTKDYQAGVLFIELDEKLYATSYEIGGLAGKTGLAKPIICDFCKTWQAGGRAGSVTFPTKRRSADSVSFLCCQDLLCSLHVRNLTSAAKTSRSQLREDMTPERRVERLRAKLTVLVNRLNLEPIL